MTEQTWTNYYDAYAVIGPKMKAFMSALTAEFPSATMTESNADDSGYVATFTQGGITYYAELELWDAANSGDEAEPGEKGNVHLTVCREGGEIIVSWAPHNYTYMCWVPYTDTDELLHRIPDTDEALTVAEAICADAERGGE
jgi:hypothetical protein